MLPAENRPLSCVMDGRECRAPAGRHSHSVHVQSSHWLQLIHLRNKVRVRLPSSTFTRAPAHRHRLCPHAPEIERPSVELLPSPIVGDSESRSASSSSQSGSKLREAAGPGANASVAILLFAAQSESHARQPATSVAALRRLRRTRVQRLERAVEEAERAESPVSVRH